MSGGRANAWTVRVTAIDSVGRMPTDRQRDLIERAQLTAAADPRIRAAWLAGSFANGTADDHADIDLHLLVGDADFGTFRTGWADLARAIGPMVLVRQISGIAGGYAITPDWLHLDIVCYPESSFDPAGLRGCLPLFDRTGKLPTLPTLGPSMYGEPYFPAEEIDFYYYLLGNLAVVLGRGELTLASNGSIMRRDLGLVPLMLAENGVRKTDGNKRLNPYLTDAQRAVLESLPPVAADHASVIAFDRLVAAEVSRRGRALAARTGAEWPAELERATLDYLRRELELEVPG